MAVTCARCGTQNPDGNQFCQSCGTPLTARPSAVAAPPPAPVGPPPPAPPAAYASPPMPGPPAYSSPYYAPSAQTAPVHRTPWMLIIAGVVGLIVLMAGCGTALAVIGSRASSGNNTSGTTLSDDLSSPSPASTPSPVASPVATPSPGQSGGTTESNDGLSITIPAGWSVANKDSESLVLTDPDSEGSITVAAGESSPTQTAQDNKATMDAFFKKNYPDARPCPGTSTTNTTLNGARGLSYQVCFTLTAGGQAVPAASSLFVGANTSGSVYYIVMVVTRQANLVSYVTKIRPVIATITWKLT
jgi:hypothetical protein